MYSVSVRDHMFIAHSLKGHVFGPAQNLHGATYVVDAEFSSDELDKDNVVIEIGQATRALSDALAELNYRCLDELPQFRGMNTTSEFLARYVHDEMRRRLPADFTGSFKVILHESDRSLASYTAPAVQ